MTRSVDTRTELQRSYALGDQLKAQLDALATTVPGARVTVSLAPEFDGDIEALAFLVLMQASESAREDLRAIMEQVSDLTKQQNRVRRAIDQPMSDGLDPLAALSLMTALAAEALINDIESDRDSLGEMSESLQMKLQMYLERLSQAMSALSNIMKKLADASSQITQNLK